MLAGRLELSMDETLVVSESSELLKQKSSQEPTFIKLITASCCVRSNATGRASDCSSIVGGGTDQ